MSAIDLKLIEPSASYLLSNGSLSCALARPNAPIFTMIENKISVCQIYIFKSNLKQTKEEEITILLLHLLLLPPTFQKAVFRQLPTLPQTLQATLTSTPPPQDTTITVVAIAKRKRKVVYHFLTMQQKELQKEGKNKILAEEFIKGNKLEVGFNILTDV